MSEKVMRRRKVSGMAQLFENSLNLKINLNFNSSLLLLVLLVVSSQLISVSQARPSVQDSDDLNRKTEDEEQTEFNMELKRKFLANLGFDQVPDYTVQPRNISKEEYLRAYTEYMINVRERRRRERGDDESTHPKTRRKQAGIFVETLKSTVTPSQNSIESTDFTESQVVIERGSLRFSLDLDKNVEWNHRLQVRDALLFLPKDCSTVNPMNLTSGNEIDQEDSSDNLNMVDMTRNVSRLVTQNIGHGGVIIFQVEVNCWNGKNKNKEEDVEGSLKIVWMKTRIGGSGNGNGNVNVLSRRTRSVNSGTFGMVERNHNNILKQHQHQRHRLSDFVDSEQTMNGDDNSNNNNGGGGSSSGRMKRGRRKHSKDCGQTKHGKTCCRKPLVVSFEDLKITDVILAPSRFNMDYCDGRCSANARRLPYASNHAMFQHILNRTKGKEHAPKLCCTPTKLSEIDVIQMDPNSPDSLKVTVIHNARVEECGCS